MAEELEPCPFCGGAADGPHFDDYFGDTYMPRWRISCNDCEFEMVREGEEPDAVIAAWNRRSPATTVCPECHGAGHDSRYVRTSRTTGTLELRFTPRKFRFCRRHVSSAPDRVNLDQEPVDNTAHTC